MNHMRQVYIFVAVLILITVFLQGCNTQLPLKNTEAPTSLATPSPSPTLPSSEIQTTTASPSPMFISPSIASTSSQIPVASPAPSQTPTASNKSITNAFTASDGKYIYYYSTDGIHRMDISGDNDKKTTIQNDFYMFIHLDDNGLYYLANDDIDYSPECDNDHGQTFHSFILKVYDLQTQRIRTIREHLYDVVEAEKMIYMLDHMDHTCILSYDIKTEKIKNVTGSTAEGNQYKSAYLQVIDDKVYLSLGKYYLIANDIINNEPAEVVAPSLGGSNEISPWAKEMLDSAVVNDVQGYFNSGDKLYLLSVIEGNVDDKGYETDTITIYEATPDGQIRKLINTSAYYDSESSIFGNMINGWFFCFTKWGMESGQISKLLFKLKVY